MALNTFKFSRNTFELAQFQKICREISKIILVNFQLQLVDCQLGKYPAIRHYYYSLSGGTDPSIIGHSICPKLSAASASRLKSLCVDTATGLTTSWNLRSIVHCSGCTNNARPVGHVNNRTPFIIPSLLAWFGSSSSSSTPTIRIFVLGMYPIHRITP